MSARSKQRSSVAGNPRRYRTPDLIASKRDGAALSEAELRWLIRAYVAGEVPDYQMSAFAMAVLFRGMTVRETTALTLAMCDSGRRLHVGSGGPARVDKHSTGGVGDKVSICLAPLLAACGLRVPMISGRGLGHTGGTLDKLEAIPGFRVTLPFKQIERQVLRHGVALVGQTREIAPADRKLYALRDVTATVESIPLITASILSKKLAESLDALVLDVKVGRGAFMETQAAARALAHSIVQVGHATGLRVSALLTDMDAPLGRAVGNALETREACELLAGNSSPDLLECTLALGVELLMAARVVARATQARRLLQAALDSGRALTKLEAVVRAQGGDARVVREPDRLPKAAHVMRLRAPRAGFVQTLDAFHVAECCLALGAGRTRADQAIDPRVGVWLHKKPGDRIQRGDALADVHAQTPAAARRVTPALLAAYKFSAQPPAQRPLVIERVAKGRGSRAD